MLLFVIGPPGEFSSWCTAAVAALAERGGAKFPSLRADTLEHVSVELMRAGVSQAVIESNEPTGPLVAALVETGRNFVVALDDPLEAFEQIAATAGPAVASRRIANSCALLLGCMEQPGALVLHAAREGQDRVAAAMAIARHLGLSLASAEAADLVRGLAERDGRSAADSALPRHELDEPGRQLAAGAIEHYVSIFANREPPPIFWAPDLFFRGDMSGQPAVGALDITGRPRLLLYGPGIRVLPGSWSIALSMGFSALAAEHEFMIELAGCEPVHRAIFRPPNEGRFEGAVEISVPTADIPLDIRLSSQRAAFDGAIWFYGVRLSRTTAARDQGEAEQVALTSVEE